MLPLCQTRNPCAAVVMLKCLLFASPLMSLIWFHRMDEVALVGSLLEGSSKSVNFDGARRMALKQIEDFLLSFSDPHIFSVSATSSAPATLAQVVEAVQIQEAGHLRCRCAFDSC